MASSNSLPACARFDQFHVDLSSGVLQRAGVRVPVQSQPLQVLRLLLQAEGKVVSRDEIRKLLWPEDTFVDFELGVNTAVKKLRQALADPADHPRFIETLPKIGYRFLIPVEWVPNHSAVPVRHLSEHASPSPLTTAPKAPYATTWARRWREVVGLAVVALLAITYAAFRGRSEHVAQPKIESLAVLPLKNLSGDPSQEYLAEGMTEALIGRLSSDPRSARDFPHVGDALQESAGLGARDCQNAGSGCHCRRVGNARGQSDSSHGPVDSRRNRRALLVGNLRS